MNDALIHGYLDAKQRIIAAGYEGDVTWAENLERAHPGAAAVMRECAWVIVNSGFRNSVAVKLWPRLGEAFCDWDLQQIDEACVAPALAALNHEGKILAIVEIAGIIREKGHEGIVAAAKDPPLLTELPWIGKITCWHLAKVLGADVVKPDIHLQRAAKAAGFETPLAMAEAIQTDIGERLTVVDSVLWRYGEQRQARKWPAWPELWSNS